MGSAQRDAMQKIGGSFGVRNMSTNIGVLVYQSGAFYESESPTTGGNDSVSQGGVSGVRTTTLDSSRVARTSTETRSANTAFAPRLIAY